MTCLAAAALTAAAPAATAELLHPHLSPGMRSHCPAMPGSPGIYGILHCMHHSNQDALSEHTAGHTQRGILAPAWAPSLSSGVLPACAGSRQALRVPSLMPGTPLHSTMCEAALLPACFPLKQLGRHMALAGQLLARDGALTSRPGALGIVLAV